MSLSDFEATSSPQCRGKGCTDRAAVIAPGERRWEAQCFAHAFRSALEHDEEAKAVAMVWATKEIERLQESKR